MSNRSHSGGPTDRDRAAPSTDEVARDFPLSADTAEDLRSVADRIDDLAGSLSIGPARHHARRAAMAARTAADGEASLVARRVALGEIVTELRTAADDAAATRTQYELLECLYEDALPVTREASGAIYG
ncbi:hypothetical protein [Haloplanus salilacus]|uniref:hypothetical protein n=1 Tax=Haloplanus salilacus TaxID=2949994 RepID=UPI0030D31A97